MSMAEIFHSFNMRSQRGSMFSLHSHNKTLWIAAIAALAATTAVSEIPFLANAFGFTGVGIVEYAVALGIGLLIIPIVEVVKFLQRKYGKETA
jgi:Ca2+-transporting ATPase